MKLTFAFFAFFGLLITQDCICTTDMPLSEIKAQLQMSENDIYTRSTLEISTFVTSGIWKGGYYEGNPQDPEGNCSYPVKMLLDNREVNALYVCYLKCIIPYVFDKDVLELGPGRGAWSRAILSLKPKSFQCLDALPAEYNCFWDNIKKMENIHYHQIFDLSLSEIQDNSIDYVFSFGTFCHISPLLIQVYLQNLYPKLRNGAKCMIMYADFDKKNHYSAKYNQINEYGAKEDALSYYRKNPVPGAWYHMGKERMQHTLTEIGYNVISADVEANNRDPIVYFVK